MGILIIKESILDIERKNLADDIWQKVGDDYQLLPAVKDYIIKSLTEFLSKNNVDYTVVKKLHLVGSITSYTYNDNSDIDVSVYVEVGDDIFNVLIGDVLNVNSKEIPNTKHPLNFYILNNMIDEPKDAGAKYDINNNTWIIKPKRRKVELDYISVMTLAISECRAIDNDFDELRRDIIDYFLLKHDLTEIYELILPEKEIKEMIRKKNAEIFADLDSLKKRFIQIHEYRNMAFTGADKEEYLTKIVSDEKDNNYTINNIIYKHLERYNYINLLKKCVDIHKSLYDGEKNITPEIENSFKELMRFGEIK